MSDSPGTFGSGQPSDEPPFGHQETVVAGPDFEKRPAQQSPTEQVPTQQVPGPLPPPPPPSFEPPASFEPPPPFEAPPPFEPPPPQPASFDAPPTQLAQVPAAPSQPVPAPPEPAPLMGGEPVLVSIGDISVTATQVYTPSGTRPLTDVQWSVTDMSLTNEGIPTWAIVCAVVFFLFCFLGLLFLLVKETTTKGSVQVSVYGAGLVHTTQIPVSSPAQIADIHARVSYVRALNAAAAGMQPPFAGGQVPGIGQAPGTGQGPQPGQAW